MKRANGSAKRLQTGRQPELIATHFVMTLKILFLTYAFPPIQSAESPLSAKALGSLLGVDVDVITMDMSNLGLPIDSSLDKYVNERFRSVSRLKPPRWCSAWLFSKLRFLAHFPDRCSIFNDIVFKEAARRNPVSYDLVITWSQWHSIHLVGTRLKRKFPQMRWVAHLSDPWADNPYLPSLPGYRVVQKLLEAKMMNAVDLLQVTTTETAELIVGKYPAALRPATAVIPHCFDETLFGPKSLASKPGVFQMRYLGNFYGQRTPAPLIKALHAINSESPQLLEQVSIELVGHCQKDGESQRLLLELPQGLIRFGQSVSYVESLRLMTEADCLIVIDAPFEYSVFLPSKLIDYLGANRPIIAFSPEGATARLIHSYGGLVVNPGQFHEVTNLLKSVLQMRHAVRDGKMASKQEVRHAFSAQSVAKTFLDSIRLRWPELGTKLSEGQ